MCRDHHTFWRSYECVFTKCSESTVRINSHINIGWRLEGTAKSFSSFLHWVNARSGIARLQGGDMLALDPGEDEDEGEGVRAALP